MPEDGAAAPTLIPMMRSIFLRWERLRILYNLILAGLVLFPTGGSFELPDFRRMPELAIGAVLANLCYLAGPVVECYLAWLGLKARWVTPALFFSGVVISLPLVFTFGLAYALMNS